MHLTSCDRRGSDVGGMIGAVSHDISARTRSVELSNHCMFKINLQSTFNYYNYCYQLKFRSIEQYIPYQCYHQITSLSLSLMMFTVKIIIDLNALQRSRYGVWLNRSAREQGVKQFVQFWELYTALHKNWPFLNDSNMILVHKITFTVMGYEPTYHKFKQNHLQFSFIFVCDLFQSFDLVQMLQTNWKFVKNIWWPRPLSRGISFVVYT